MSLDVRHMSQQELQFLKAYALTLRRYFSVFVSALNMMRTTELDLKCPVEAARLAHGLNDMHADFEQTLAEIIKNDKFRVRSDGVEHPTAEEITQIIHVSFFKLVQPGQTQKVTEDLGWFSGHPLEWEKAWKQAIKFDMKGPTNVASALLNALVNLFNVSYPTKFKKPPDKAYEEPEEDDDWYENDDDYGHH